MIIDLDNFLRNLGINKHLQDDFSHYIIGYHVEDDVDADD